MTEIPNDHFDMLAASLDEQIQTSANGVDPKLHLALTTLQDAIRDRRRLRDRFAVTEDAMNDAIARADRNWQRVAAAEKRVTELEAEHGRYIDTSQHWAVRLSRGTFLEFYYDEETARRRAAMYHGTLLVCDALSTDWREVGQASEVKTDTTDSEGSRT